MPSTTLLLSALLLIGLDQTTKTFVVSRVGEGRRPSFGRMAIRRALTPDCGGLLAGPRALLILWVVEVALLLSLVELAPSFQRVATQVALGVALGGATANLVDRLWRGGVVDFIDVGFWPVFNVADVAIVAGVPLALFSIV